MNKYDIESKYNKSLLLIKINKFENAINELNEIIELLNKIKSNFNRRLFEVYYNIGYCYNKLNKYQDAIIAISLSIKLNSNYCENYYQKGKSLFYLDEIKDALFNLTKSK